ncbi:hypothetical protein ACRZ5S_22275 (plasmid) [Vibrio scophthalmi]|uniref:hypothetical protein n=1 Tax=Vibrio scophthalmi TaxID=45658 RepID=UPI003EBC1F04
MASFIIAICSLWICKYIIERTSFRLIGIPTALFGTPVHELGHYSMCKLFGFKVEEVCWFRIPTSDNPTFGYVSYLYPRTPVALIQNIIVSLGPLLTGFFSIWALSPYLEAIFISPSTGLWQISQLKDITWQDTFLLWVFCSITLHMLPSRSDIQGAMKGSFIVGTIIYVLISVGIVTGMNMSSFISNVMPRLTDMLNTSLVLVAPIVILAIFGGFFSTIFNNVNK